MTVSDAIINTYGRDKLIQIMNRPDFAKILKAAFRRDCPNYRLAWGAWANIINALKRKLANA